MKRLAFILFMLSLSAVRGGELPSIAVVDFTSDARIVWASDWRTALTTWTHGLPELISDALVNSHRFDVYEREKLNSIMREQGLQASGFADPQTVVALGKLAGIQYILTGSIIEDGREVRDFTGFGVQTRTTFYRMKAGIKVIDVKTGKVLFSRNEGVESPVTESQSSRVSDTTMDSRLAEEVANRLVRALLDDEQFKGPKESAAALLPVKVSSTPDRADVEVDGVFYGNAGSDIKLPAGLHLVTISLPGYEKWSKKVNVQEGLSINATLSKKVNERIEIETKP